MRRYDDPVEVRRRDEVPEQFLWRGRLWKVRVVQAHWTETGDWWTTRRARALIGTDDGDSVGGAAVAIDVLAERELWRVEAGRGGLESDGVFDLALDWSDGCWQLVGCLD